jgi:hypothetical protein
VQTKEEECILIPDHYSGESDENGIINLGREKVSDVFVYDAQSGEKIKIKTSDLEKGIVAIDQVYCDVEVDFNFCYQNKATACILGRKLIEGYLLLEGKSRVKDDITGKTRTAILRIPRLKLVSDLTMRLGREATPVLANFNAIGLPTGERGNKQIMELLFLSDDIDADM